MPKIILSFFLLAVSLYGQYSSAGLRDQILEQPQARAAGLIALMTDFCLRGYTLPTVVTQASCALLSAETVAAMSLDSQRIDRGDGQEEVFSIVFNNELLALAQTPRSHQVLEQIDFDLTYRTSEFQLYQSVYSVLKNHKSTIRWIAVMLQDTSEKMAQVHYLKAHAKKTMLSARIIQSLTNLILKIKSYEQSGIDVLKPGQLLPNSIKLEQNFVGWRIYHLYVPAYLANTLISRGVDIRRAAYGAAMMNFSYEAITVGGGLQYPTGFSPFKPNRAKAFDMYAGYLGACYGIGKPFCLANASEFRSLIAEDSLLTVKAFRQRLQDLK